MKHPALRLVIGSAILALVICCSTLLGDPGVEWARVQALEAAEAWDAAAESYHQLAQQQPEAGERLRAEANRCLFQSRLKQRCHSPYFLRHLSVCTLRDSLTTFRALLDARIDHGLKPCTAESLVKAGLSELAWALENTTFRHIAFTADLSPFVLARLKRDLEVLNQHRLITSKDAAEMVQAQALDWQFRHGGRPTALVQIFSLAAARSGDPWGEYLLPPWFEWDAAVGGAAVSGLDFAYELRGNHPRVVVKSGSLLKKAGLRLGDELLMIDDTPAGCLSPAELELLLYRSQFRATRLTWKQLDQEQSWQGVLSPSSEPPPTVLCQVVASPAETTLLLGIRGFTNATAAEVDKALVKLAGTNQQSVILDLRGNSGGCLTAAVAVAGRFLPMGSPVCRLESRGAMRQTWQQTTTAPLYKGALVVLVDEGTASAAEALAAALADHGFPVVGRTTRGKGCVQNLLRLPPGKAGLRLTTARWLTPADKDLSQTGLRPSVFVHGIGRSVTLRQDSANDPDMQAALGLLKEFRSETR